MKLSNCRERNWRRVQYKNWIVCDSFLKNRKEIINHWWLIHQKYQRIRGRRLSWIISWVFSGFVLNAALISLFVMFVVAILTSSSKWADRFHFFHEFYNNFEVWICDFWEIIAILVYLKQKLKTRVIKKDVNPEWNEDLTLSITDPNMPIKLVSILVSCEILL